jgi:CDP-diacylglycerol--glycerol-3-phosphate 3-phosphatidyltransferase
MYRLIPNVLSTTRVVMAPCLLVCPPQWRVVLLLIAVVTDFLDGRLARRWNAVSSFGTIIDPIGDKALALAFVGVFWSEGIIRVPELIAFFSRDIALFLFGMYCLASTAQRPNSPFWSGKVASTTQAIIATFWCFNSPAPVVLSILMALCGVSGLIELVYKSRISEKIVIDLQKTILFRSYWQ